MQRIVLKFGGTSVGSIEKIQNVAKIIKKKHDEGNKIVVVVSAMSGVTTDLLNKSKLISKNFDPKELDVLLSSGEQISSSLLAAAILNLGINSRSWLGWQIPIVTNDNHTTSQILKIKTAEILKFISSGGVAVVAGFQGITENERITTLGRGGSDLSAVAIAKFFETDSCEIYTDVEGVLTTDPNMYEKAKKIDKISYEEMLEMASLGAKVMQPIAVQASMIDDIPVHVRSTFSNKSGTKIVSDEDINHKKAVTGIAYSKNNAKVSIVGVIDKPGVAADIFEPIGENNINIDMVIQNTSLDGKIANITFTIKQEDLKETLSIIEKNKQKINYEKIIHNEKLAKVSIVGAGMTTSPGVTHKMFRSLANEKINILAISTSEIKISVLIQQDLTQKAVKILHEAFKLN
ncbi:MAG: aspartate kinase [Pelagibacterales bacterium]|nr:aspartate kinase [Pelagibacterales bacterium]